MESHLLLISKARLFQGSACKSSLATIVNSRSHFYFFQNGKMLSVNFERDPHLLDMIVPLELLKKVILMRCLSGFKTDCTMPGGLITDFNIWDRSFSADDMKLWTTCQYIILFLI